MTFASIHVQSFVVANQPFQLLLFMIIQSNAFVLDNDSMTLPPEG